MVSRLEDETSPVDVETKIEGLRKTGKVMMSGTRFAKAGGPEEFSLDPALARGAESFSIGPSLAVPPVMTRTNLDRSQPGMCTSLRLDRLRRLIALRSTGRLPGCLMPLSFYGTNEGLQRSLAIACFATKGSKVRRD